MIETVINILPEGAGSPASSPIKDLFGIVTALVAIVGGLIAASKAIKEMKRSNEQRENELTKRAQEIQQREEDLRWKRAEMAKKCVDEIFAQPLARAALKMQDWSNIKYDLPGGGKSGTIRSEERRVMLRTTGTSFAEGGDERFVRDAFDALFDALGMLEHLIEIRLIEFADVEEPFKYYVAKLARPKEYPVILKFLEVYSFDLAVRFLLRYPAWRTMSEPVGVGSAVAAEVAAS